MERNFKDYALISLKGIAMGAADVVPGVSGGTIAFISGIYEELVTTISGINLGLLKEWREFGFSSMWKKANGNFIIALFLGIAISVFTVMRLANYLLENHPILIWSFFFGLVIASIWFVGKQIPKWNAKIITALVLGAAVAFYITTLPPITGTQSPLFLFIAGAIAVCAIILVLLGAYKTISEAIHDFDFKTIGIVAVGAVVGLLSFSRVLKWLFLKYKAVTLAVLTGFITGSLNKIWPWKEILETVTVGDKDMVIREQSVLPQHFDGDPQLIFALLLMVAGFLLILILERVATQQANA
jgi:putative membrane protein